MLTHNVTLAEMYERICALYKSVINKNIDFN